MKPVKTVEADRMLRLRLAEAQQNFIDSNPKSRAQLLLAAQCLPGGNTRSVLFYDPFPLVMVRGEGCRLWDLDGHAYIDLLGEFTAGIYGHSHPVITQAMVDAIRNGLNLAAHGIAEADLARVICARFPSIELVRFTNSGTEANIMAVAAAKCFTGRRKVLVFNGGYHGGVLNFVVGNSPLNVPHEYVLGEYNDLQSVEVAFNEHGSELAAVLVEPMMGSSGCIAASNEFLALLRLKTQKCGAVLIFDEVMTSRLSGGGMQEVLGIHSDLTTLGKYLGGGSSFGAFGGRSDIMDLFDPRRPDALPHAGTFNNNVISMAAGLAGLTQVYTAKEAKELSQRGDELRTRLNRIFRDHSARLQATGMGSLMNLHATLEHIVRPPRSDEVQQLIKSLLFFELLQRGFYIARRGFIALSLAVGDAQTDSFCDAVTSFLDRDAALIRAQ